MFDVDGSGDIDKDEMYGAMNAIGLRSTREEVDKLIDDIDEDGNGVIDFEEFV